MGIGTWATQSPSQRALSLCTAKELQSKVNRRETVNRMTCGHVSERQRQTEVWGLGQGSQEVDGTMEPRGHSPQRLWPTVRGPEGPGLGWACRSACRGRVRTAVSPSLKKLCLSASFSLFCLCFATQTSGCPTLTPRENKAVLGDCSVKKLYEASGKGPGCWHS